MAWYHNGRKYWYHNGKRYSCRAKRRAKTYYWFDRGGKRHEYSDFDYDKVIELRKSGKRVYESYDDFPIEDNEKTELNINNRKENNYNSLDSDDFDFDEKFKEMEDDYFDSYYGL